MKIAPINELVKHYKFMRSSGHNTGTYLSSYTATIPTTKRCGRSLEFQALFAKPTAKQGPELVLEHYRGIVLQDDTATKLRLQYARNARNLKSKRVWKESL
jgi:hypothetical protein